MSQHSAMPLDDSRLDLADLYVFDGERGTVFVMDANSSLTGGDDRGFRPGARYEFKVHFDDEPYERLTYRFVFGDRGPDGRQPLRMSVLEGAVVDDGADALLVETGTTGTPLRTHDGTGVRLWAGTAVDPFYLDLTQLEAVQDAVQGGHAIAYGDWSPAAATNSFEGARVEAIVLELPSGYARVPANQHIRVWGTTKVQSEYGGWLQVNRAGHPMMWPIFRADGSDYATELEAVHPADEGADDAARVAELTAGIAAAGGTTDPVAYGQTVAGRLMPDVLPYQVGTPAGLSFADSNGRTLADNAPEVMFSLVANTAVSTGITPAQTVDTRDHVFPYVVPVLVP